MHYICRGLINRVATQIYRDVTRGSIEKTDVLALCY